MADVQLRSLYRRGEYTRLTRAAQRIGALIEWCYQYASNLAPPSILETTCATKKCTNILRWSNCCYCPECYGKGFCVTNRVRIDQVKVAVANFDGQAFESDYGIDDCACSTAGIMKESNVDT